MSKRLEELIRFKKENNIQLQELYCLGSDSEKVAAWTIEKLDEQEKTIEELRKELEHVKSRRN